MEDICFYLRLYDNSSFGFICNSVYSPLDTDILIAEEDYEKFFSLQSEGKKFRLKENNTGKGLFDYIEEYTPERK